MALSIDGASDETGGMAARRGLAVTVTGATRSQMNAHADGHRRVTATRTHATAVRRSDPIAGTLLALQRSAGNEAVTRLLSVGTPPVQRCGAIPAEACGCHG